MFTTNPVLLLRGEGATLTGYSYFWMKFVTGFDPTQHCARCLRGGYVAGVSKDMELNTPLDLVLPRTSVGYICGVARGRNYARNLHLPFVREAGNVERMDMLDGQELVLSNARRLPIPGLPDGWADLPKAFTTCRNFQFAVDRFGFDEVAVRAANRGCSTR